MRARRLGAIAVGAVAGGALRWLALSGLGGDPYAALLLVNTAASGVLGWLQAAVRGGRWVRRDAADLIGAGFCGTLSTWSALAVRLGDDLLDGSVARAVAWGGASIAAGVSAAWAGARLQRGRGAAPPAVGPEASA
ncbi:MAG: CrcB family protein [Acidobacteria bacterium]|nr:CrcB family protein [Acidobacteriota bacterium]